MKSVRNTVAVLFQFRLTGYCSNTFLIAAKAGNGGLAWYENDSVGIRWRDSHRLFSKAPAGDQD